MNEKEKIKTLRNKMLRISEKTEINFSTMPNEEFDKWVEFLIKHYRE